MESPQLTYHSNGLLAASQCFKNGLAHGLSIWYWPSGIIQERLIYVNGKLEGYTELYYETGELELLGCYYQGKADGVFEWYYPSGSIQARISYQAGIKHGPFI